MDDWLKAERYAEAAKLLAERGRWRWALRQLDLALTLDPNRGDWQAERGVALDGLGRYGEAVDAYARAIELGEVSPGLRLNLGIDLARVAAYEESAEMLQAAAAMDAAWVDPWIELVAVETARGDMQARDEAFFTGQQIDDSQPALYVAMAHSVDLQDDHERAALCWREVLKRDARHPDARLELARCHWRFGRTERARRLYVQQLNLDPTDTAALLELGGLLASLDRRGEAAATLRSLVELEPENAEAHAALGEIALRQGHADAARRRFRRAQRLEPDRPGIHLGLARAALAENEHGTAQDHARVELARHPTDPTRVVELARVLLELDLTAEAIELLEPWDNEWAELGSERLSADAALLYGVAHLIRGDASVGLRACRESYRLDPSLSIALCNVVMALTRHGSVRRARAVMRRLERQHPHDPHLKDLARRIRLAAWRRRLSRLWPAPRP
ncbi:MAG: tetratricopeptide repeat protein [Planctomycetota bacterium]